MTRVVKPAAQGAMGSPKGLGAFTRMLRANKNARKLVQNKVRNAKQSIMRAHKVYTKLMREREASRR